MLYKGGNDIICEDFFSQFLKLLSSNEDTFAISQRAFEPVAEKYHIKDITYSFKVGSSAFTPGGALRHGRRIAL